MYKFNSYQVHLRRSYIRNLILNFYYSLIKTYFTYLLMQLNLFIKYSTMFFILVLNYPQPALFLFILCSSIEGLEVNWQSYITFADPFQYLNSGLFTSKVAEAGGYPRRLHYIQPYAYEFFIRLNELQGYRDFYEIYDPTIFKVKPTSPLGVSAHYTVRIPNFYRTSCFNCPELFWSTTNNIYNPSIMKNYLDNKNLYIYIPFHLFTLDSSSRLPYESWDSFCPNEFSDRICKLNFKGNVTRRIRTPGSLIINPVDYTIVSSNVTPTFTIYEFFSHLSKGVSPEGNFLWEGDLKPEFLDTLHRFQIIEKSLPLPENLSHYNSLKQKEQIQIDLITSLSILCEDWPSSKSLTF